MSFVFPNSAFSHNDLLDALDALVLSASGWRGVFAASGREQDTQDEARPELLYLSALMADTFADWVKKSGIIVLGRDTRPTGKTIALAMLNAFLRAGAAVEYSGIICAPEIMAYTRGNSLDKTKKYFAYVSASHNPVGHNGVKFGSGGGVLSPDEERSLRARFIEKCRAPNAVERARELLCEDGRFAAAQENSAVYKKAAYAAYFDFARQTTGIEHVTTAAPRPASERKAVAADFNGSARCVSIDRKFFEGRGFGFFAFNETPGLFAHGIIPEAQNLAYAARALEELQEGRCKKFPGAHTDAALAYACDCDGDRGNIVYYSLKKRRAEILSAQEVFALCVLAELCRQSTHTKRAVVCNCPTSMRVDEIARVFGAEVFRAEVGEANVVSLAQKARGMGFEARVAGEGSNGGFIAHPSRVRDPLNTVCAILSLLDSKSGKFKTWLQKSGQKQSAANFSLEDIIESLPAYTTTGVSEERAKLEIKMRDHAVLKKSFQKEFEAWFDSHKSELAHNGIVSWKCVSTNGIIETRDVTDFARSGQGGLKIVFFDSAGGVSAFMWMRGSGTENVFRVLCDVKGSRGDLESTLLNAERAMLLRADSALCRYAPVSMAISRPLTESFSSSPHTN
jgi:phosphoglucomutase